MNRPSDQGLGATARREEKEAGQLPPSQLQELSEEVVDLLYMRSFAADETGTEASVCEAFANLLLRHWELCCIVTFLRNEEGELRETAVHLHAHLNGAAVRRAVLLLVGEVERTEQEQQLFLDEEEAAPRIPAPPSPQRARQARKGANGGQPAAEETYAAQARAALAEAGLRAAVAIPIRALGSLVGVVIVTTLFPERLRAALKGVRFIAAPIVIALGHARRATAMREQHQRIGQLVEELQRHSAALEEANRELQRVARYRSLFLARMSHELRTPLTSILGFAEILLDQEMLTDTQRRYCEKIQSSGQQLQTSLNQLVDLSRLESGQTELFLHEFSLRETLRESCAAVGRLAQKQQVKLVCSLPAAVGRVVSDEGKLRQVLYNFLAHAISRSPAGGEVQVRYESAAPESFLITIADEGAPLADPEQLFDPVDVDAVNERGTNFNELGVAIARRLVVALGGSVTLAAPAPHGLVARLELPHRPKEK